jgi:hypothetical protein
LSFGQEESKNSKKCSVFHLKSKKNPKHIMNFRLFKEKHLKFLSMKDERTGGKILNFDMSKLEMEYDYDTDSE